MEIEGLHRPEENEKDSMVLEENKINNEELITQNTQIFIDNDKKYHQRGYLMSLGLLENEMKQVIASYISSAEMNEEIKQYLEAKKKELDAVYNNLLKMFSGGQLDSTKYLQIVEKMKVANSGLVEQLQAENKFDDLFRVQQRLNILTNEYQTYQEKIKNEMNIEKPSPVQTGMTASTFFSKVDKLSPQGLAKLLQRRIPQYWALANFLNEHIAPSVGPKEQKEIKERLENYFYPLMTQATQYQQELETGNKTVEAVKFLRKEMPEMTPELLHGKTLDERRDDLKLLMDEVEGSLKEETEYINILKTSAEDPTQTLAVIKNRFKEATMRTQKYQEYIEALSKMGSDKYAWVPTPKILINKEQRLVNLVNNEIPANSLQVIFKRLGSIVRGYYWIRWTIETHEGYKMFETDYCDSNMMAFEYSQILEMTSRTKLDSTIEKKEITIEVLYKKLRILHECKYAEGSISLADFSKTNTIEGKLKLKDAEGKDNSELHYVLKIRQPSAKSSRIEVSTVHTFQTFPVFNKDSAINHQAPIAKPTIQKQSPAKPVETSSQNQASVIAPPTSNVPIQNNDIQPKPQPQSQPQKPQEADGGLFKKLTYPPLVLLKQEKDPLASLDANEIPAELTLEEVMNPLDPDHIVSITVLNTLVPILETSRGGLAKEGRRHDNKFIGDMWGKALKKVTILEARFGEGEIDPYEYLAQIKGAVVKDTKAKGLYERKQDIARLAFIKEKIAILEKEIKELEEGLAHG